MGKSTTISQAAQMLRERDNFLILTHVNPDGDTLGSGFALARALRLMGKSANVINSEELPLRYLFLFESYKPQDFEPLTIIAVDIADVQLLGDKLSVYKDSVDLCIDHHISNTFYAAQTLLDSKAAATCEVVYGLIHELGVEIDNNIAKCLYTGIATDTGCFKYGNTTVRTHEIAASLISHKIDFAMINHLMFDLKTKNRLIAEKKIIDSMEFFLKDMCCMVILTKNLMDDAGVSEEEFDGLSNLPRQVEGVHVGITIKERDENYYKISMRSSDIVNVSEVCQTLGGGGHARAAGCQISATLEDTKKIVLAAVEKALSPYLSERK